MRLQHVRLWVAALCKNVLLNFRLESKKPILSLPMLPIVYPPMIVQSADQYDVDPLLIAATIRQESSYRSYVTSPSGAVGLTQIMPRYWQQACPGDLFDEYTNVRCGTMILAKYNQSAGSWKKALAYYNVGPTNYQTNRKMKRQGKRYAKQVKQHEKQLKSSL